MSSYPDADEMADIDEIGEVSNEWLDQTVSKECICNVDEIGTLIKALGGLKHERLWEIADCFFAEMFLPVIS